ncbi:MAG: hypothetical protein V2J08_12770 [Desulfotignum sp.]|nr:hypothetical protein [Desulfotignum sp.]
MDQADLATFASHFGLTDCDTISGIGHGSDCDVDGLDILSVIRDYGRTDCP